MILYHYSKEKYPQLKTRLIQGIVTEKEKEEGIEKAKKYFRIGPYYDHISFFIEPVPLDIIGNIFGKDHHTWYPGSVLYEHRVSVDKLTKFKFELVETPTAVDFFYDPKNDHLDIEEFCKQLYLLRIKNGESGHSKDELKKGISKLLGTTRQAYKDLPSKPNWDELKNKYAATVPHLMLYPESGIVNIDSVIKVIVSKSLKMSEW